MALPNSKWSFAQQRGIASLLILLMIGLSLTAAIIGSVYHLRVTQEQSISVHAQTQAQARAWSAAEVTRQYFEMLRQDATEWQTFYDALSTALASGTPLTLNIGMDDVVAKITRAQNLTTKTSEGEVPHVTVQITATAADGSRAMSSSTLELMYAGAEPTTGESVPNNGAINFYGGLKLNGDITVKKDTGDLTAYEINVIGNVEIGSISFTGLDIIRSTQSIEYVGSQSSIKELHANCDIRMSSSGMAGIINATNNICLENVTGTGNIEVRANGSIAIIGKNWGDVMALAGKGDFQKCAANAKRYCDGKVPTNGIDLRPTPTIKSLQSKGAIVFQSSTNLTEDAKAEGNISVPSWINLPKVTYGGTINVSPQPKYAQHVAGYSVSISPALPVNIEPDTFDVNTLKNAANYIFYYEANKMRVEVKNVTGIPNGHYYLFKGNINNSPFNDWVCSSPTPKASDCVAKIGAGQSDYNALISYTPNNTTWTLDGTSLAPGIAFFEGNLTLSNGSYYNTMLATGNISTSGSMVIYAPNFAGFNGKQNGKIYAYDKPKEKAIGICENSYFPTLKPNQFCSKGVYDYAAVNGIGNYALMAGSCEAGSCKPYVGGDIQTGASGDIFGAIKAGNLFTSSGSTTVHGYITALAQRTTTIHSMGASTTIDLRDLPPGYDPKANSTRPGSGEAGASGSMDIRWSRYL